MGGAKCLLLYRPDSGGAPATADAELLVAALQRVCGVPASRQPERQLEARCTQLSQAPARDLSVVAQPRQLSDLWAIILPNTVPERVFLCNLKATQVVEADSCIATGLLDRRLEYRTRSTFAISSRTWLLGDREGSDVAVRLLQIQAHGQAPLALALEVEYRPVSSCAAAAAVLADLAAALQGALGAGGRLDLQPAPWEEYAAWLPPQASPTHTAVLYACLVGAIIRERGQQAAAAARKPGQQQQQQQQQQPQQQQQQQQPQQQQQQQTRAAAVS
ncbi:hypothetical protein Rsub_00815 [Raphidocelis subcapitata]|uniref:Mediator of RNA polymerase II transcription subunit 20 n=1 Tax=Raphidocelis subcapitata TaxID=307507 RepID=A0A2V0NRB7_9CHLO|nr:hypothetical protein Rsub_00815 [Raphidocelis subcapitata]|eukprot:GBF88103.1 hypothetical protein Rsub_00815 [Raphidocelis subcapitata]